MNIQNNNCNKVISGELECPSCGSRYLSHKKIKIFERKEDEELGLHIEVEGMSVSADQDLFGNPSSRRNGLMIQFQCEECGGDPVMLISQHKGNTVINFVDAA